MTIGGSTALLALSSAIAASARLALLLLAALVTVASGGSASTLAGVGAVITLAVAGRLVKSSRPDVARALLVGELLVVVTAIVGLDGAVIPLLVCLTSTGLAVGLAGGYAPAVLASGTAAAALLVVEVVTGTEPADLGEGAVAVQWVTISLVIGLLGARIRSLSAARQDLTDRHEKAYRLLAELTAVSRRLPGSLDLGSVARSLMDECVAEAACQYGAVFAHAGGSQLVPVALHGYQRVPWRTSLVHDGPIQRAWLSGATVLDRRRPDAEGPRRGSVLMLLPMTVEKERVGLVALEWLDPDDLPARRAAALAALVDRYALPLRTAALFDELRMSAATDERSRMAREMHDGIAQDLAFLGYEVDTLIRCLRAAEGDAALGQAQRLRQRITDFIGDLRLSITDLRSSVGPARGLGAALSEYARSVGTSNAITVHLSLSEGPTRLAADAEVQLLRIAHDAITRARRRPGTRNLWITLVTDPPAGQLVVEDDGRTDGAPDLDRPAEGSMAERARWMGAHLECTPRTPTGTRVSVSVKGVLREYDRVAG